MCYRFTHLKAKLLEKYEDGLDHLERAPDFNISQRMNMLVLIQRVCELTGMKARNYFLCRQLLRG